MKTVLLQNRIVLSYTMIGFAMMLLAGSPLAGNAQSAISNAPTHKVSATTTMSYKSTEATGNYPSTNPTNTYTYNYGLTVGSTANIEILDSVQAFGVYYHYQPSSYFVKFRRVDNATVTGLR